MKGARAFTDEEIISIISELETLRDRCMFRLTCATGLRISETLSLSIGSVVQHGQVADYVKVERKNTKGKQESKILPLSNGAKEAIELHLKSIGSIESLVLTQPLFKSRKTGKAITRFRAHTILKDAFKSLGLQGSVSSHSCRKFFAHKVHKAFNNDILKTQSALCHRSLSSTAQYLSVNKEEVEQVILGLNV